MKVNVVIVGLVVTVIALTALCAYQQSKINTIDLLQENRQLQVSITGMQQLIQIAAQDSSVMQEWITRGLVTLDPK